MTSQVMSTSATLGSNNATTSEIQMANCQASLYIAGTFSATVTVQARPAGLGGAWAPVIPLGGTTAAITAAGVYAFPPLAGDWEFQAVMTPYTSGSASVTLSAGPAIG